MSEAAWLRKRRAGVSYHTQGHDMASTSCPTELPGWTAKHEKEMKHQEAKLAACKVECHMQGTLLPEEVDPTLTVEVDRKRVANKKNQDKRMKYHKRVDATQPRKCLSAADLQGMRCYIEASGECAEVVNKVALLLMQQAARVDAQLFIARNVAKLGMRSMMFAIAHGCHVITPDALLRGVGAQIKYHPAVQTERHILMTRQFREKHDIAEQVLRSIAAKSGKWKLYTDTLPFMALFTKATKTHRAAYFIALVAKGHLEDMRTHSPCERERRREREREGRSVLTT